MNQKLMHGIYYDAFIKAGLTKEDARAVAVESAKEMARNDTRFIAIEGSLGELRADVNILRADVNTLKGDVNTLKGDVSTLKGDVNTLRMDMEKSIAGLRVEMTTANWWMTLAILTAIGVATTVLIHFLG